MPTQSVLQATSQAESKHEPSAALRVIGMVVGLAVVTAILTIAFALPSNRAKPHEIPMGVSPQAASTVVAEGLEKNSPGAFKVTGYADEAALRTAILHRDIYGGVSFGPQNTLLIATGGSRNVKEALVAIGRGMQEHGVSLRTVDLAPPMPRDPGAGGLVASGMPMALAGLLSAIAALLLIKRGTWIRFAATVAGAVATTLTIAVLMRYLFGAFDQNFWLVAGGLALGALASGLVTLGLGSLFGWLGVGAAAGFFMLVSAPLAGLTSAPELLPSPWGSFGQLLPDGADGRLLRSNAFFDGAGAGRAIVVLVCWVAAGVALIVIDALRRRSTSASG